MIKLGVKYIVCSGYVQSNTDGQWHYISIANLLKLYRLSANDNRIVTANTLDNLERHKVVYPDAIQLGPRPLGDYHIKKWTSIIHAVTV